jgi:hypothetical protein
MGKLSVHTFWLLDHEGPSELSVGTDTSTILGFETRSGSAAEAGTAKARIVAKAILDLQRMLAPPKIAQILPADLVTGLHPSPPAFVPAICSQRESSLQFRDFGDKMGDALIVIADEAQRFCFANRGSTARRRRMWSSLCKRNYGDTPLNVSMP